LPLDKQKGVHGTLGWTMSSGSARLLSDLVSGKKPDIEAGDLSVERYRQSRLPEPALRGSPRSFAHLKA
jgi:hypothetical protein